MTTLTEGSFPIIFPSLGGRGWREGGTTASKKGEGSRWENFKYIWLEIRDLFSRLAR
jgi:hypothetical protein